MFIRLCGYFSSGLLENMLPSFIAKIYTFRTSRVVQGLRLCASAVGVCIQSLLGDLRFHMLCSADKTNSTKLSKPHSASFVVNCAEECGLEVRAG